MRLFVGDDWAEGHHDVEVMDEQGTVLARRRLPEGVAGMAQLHELTGRWLGEDGGEPEVAAGIETDRGPWVAALVAAGYVAYPVNPLQASRYRERHGVSGAKSDRGDSPMLADMVRTDSHQLRLSPSDVWAVGAGPGVPTGGFSAHPTSVIEHWNGTSWTVVPSPNPNPQGNNGLGAVAAVSSANVWAVREQLQGPFTEHWDGTSWSIVATPAGVRFFGAMAASSGGTVLAVGQGTNQSGIILSN